MLAREETFRQRWGVLFETCTLQTRSTFHAAQHVVLFVGWQTLVEPTGSKRLRCCAAPCTQASKVRLALGIAGAGNEDLSALRVALRVWSSVLLYRNKAWRYAAYAILTVIE